MKKELKELRTTGFRPLRPGKIHTRCPVCGRKQSNMPRQKYDIAGAFLVELACPKCSDSSPDDGDYYDKNGEWMDD